MDKTQFNVVSRNDRAYRIRKQKGGHRYPVTAPVDILDSAGVEHKEDVSFSIGVSSDGRVSVRYSSDLDGLITISASRYESTGELRIPGSIGAILELGDEKVQWCVYEDSDGSRSIVGETTKSIPESETVQGDSIAVSPFMHITQETSHNGGQEQFRLYLNTEMLSPLGWAPNQRVEIDLEYSDSKPVIVFSPTNSTQKHKTKKASDTGSGQVDATLNVPTAFVRSLNLVDVEFELVARGDELLLYPKQPWQSIIIG